MRKFHYRWLLICLLALSACAPPEAEPVDELPLPTTMPPVATSTPSGSTTITFAAQTTKDAYAPLIAAFEAVNPDIRVQFVPLPSFEMDKSERTKNRQTAASADTFISCCPNADWVSNGYVLDLAPFIKADATFDANDYYPGALEQNRSGGVIAYLPTHITADLLVYNKRLWAERGLAPPVPGWTTDDLITAAAQLVSNNGSDLQTYGLLDFFTSDILLQRQIAKDTVASSSPAVTAFDDPKLAAALTQMADYSATGVLWWPGRNDGSLFPNEVMPVIAAGRVGMWPESFMDRDKSVEFDFELGYTTSPIYDRPFLYAGGSAISGGTQHPTPPISLHCWHFARSAASPCRRSRPLPAPRGASAHTASTWYEPLTAQEDIDLAVHWVLGQPDVFLNTVGDLHVLPPVFDAASRFTTRPSDEAMQAAVVTLAMEPLFT